MPPKKQEDKKSIQTGITSPVEITDELGVFLELPKGSKIARCQVTKKIAEYIKKNELQNPEDKRQILPDEKLKTLLNPPKGFKLTYFNIQTLLKPHFIKKTKL
jgi:upstream activation factor subunit UAF30